ncbi:unnamed protein product [Bursaphelenchus xylophilus]|nr:unnamed protein product [Bursaphelenchus xylophilus]CAG9119000.1 unnamed protein product [Bursaphelenchus xylophilus]
MSLQLLSVNKAWLTTLGAAGALALILFPKFRRILYTIPRDIRAILTLFHVKYVVKKAQRLNKPMHWYFLNVVKRNPQKIAVEEVETGRKFTLKELNDLANKYANMFKSKGFKKDDTVGLFLENSADFVALWIGLSKIGVRTAWLNTHIKLEPLQYSIAAANCNSLITSNHLLTTVIDEAVSAGCIPYGFPTYTIDANDDDFAQDISPLLTDPSEPPEDPEVNFSSILCYIYTSGTTGNPKPAVIKHHRYFWMSMLSGLVCDIREDDIVYLFLPMYHSAGGILGAGQLLARGSKLVIRKKFSARNFWPEIRKYNCTASQYIGEVARYIVAQPPQPDDAQHPLRLLYGNGLRIEIWRELVERFKVPKISEFYGSTEGNANIVNLDSTIGACGLLPLSRFIQDRATVAVLKIDKDTGEFLRDKNGLCICCDPGEQGHLVGIIRDDDAVNKFEGYLNKAETDKKIIRDVFKKGDVAFASGDLFLWDEYGYLFFKDRLGDTYRWRGENVSTMEVEGVLQPVKSIQDVAVYGVEVKGREGRAGMISASLAEGAEVNDLVKEVSERVTSRLPGYAIPVFLRIGKEFERTGTFKLKKNKLKEQGFNPEACNGDELYYYDSSSKTYKHLDSQMYEDIQSGRYTKI